MNISYLPLKEAYAIRREFVNKFVDKSLDFYRYSMGHGDFYGTNSHRHCLWESFKSYNVISKKAALKIISQIPEVCVTWDHSPSKLSSNLQKSRIIKIGGEALAKALHNAGDFAFRPSDVYVFDADMQFHVTFTHQNISGFGDVCLTSLDNVEDHGISPAFQELFKTLGMAQFRK